MNSQTIVMCVVALILGILLANMLKNICGCNKVVEGMKGRKKSHTDRGVLVTGVYGEGEWSCLDVTDAACLNRKTPG